jgi:flagellar biosynthesis/type III secretory pathway protein FliH
MWRWLVDKHGFRNIQKKLRLTNEETAKVLGVELFQVQMWACGIWSTPLMAENFLHSLQDAGRDYCKGYRDGYEAGHRQSYDKGHADGLSVGYREEVWT